MFAGQSHRDKKKKKNDDRKDGLSGFQLPHHTRERNTESSNEKHNNSNVRRGRRDYILLIRSMAGSFNNSNHLALRLSYFARNSGFFLITPYNLTHNPAQGANRALSEVSK